MKISLAVLVLLLIACSKPTVPESPNPSSYGQIIKGEDRPPADQFAPDQFN